MYGKKDSIHRLQYCPWFQVFTGGLGMHSPQIWGGGLYCIKTYFLKDTQFHSTGARIEHMDSDL